ncbi:protocadherin beta-7-like protein [Labeo rohita]|uniref:Protocadherin beta-7-like protein n=1 Tax=Labeo rohita TaxID=84645 RepID=A0A498P4A3_LABRO|nr:protocadherin beta-7-like protein [Labeo rohita]
MEHGLFSVPFFTYFVALILFALRTVCDDLSYNIAEETKRQYVIGNIAKDLRLDVKQLSARKARIDTEDSSKRYCDINLNTGDLIVAETIDREELCGSRMSCILSYELVLENPLEVHRIILQIKDINDNAPRFPNELINFEITESAVKGQRFRLDEAHDKDIGQNGSLVSKVIAVDADSGQNAWLSYQIVRSTDPGLFSIGLHSGEIKTQRDISESDNMKQNLVISVKDNGQPSLSTTCAVNLLISDNLSEVPELKDMTYEDSNSKLTSYLIIALVCVSTFFLTFIILIVAVKFCHRRKPRLLFDGAVAVPSAYLPPNYAEVDGAGTLRSSYNYDAYLTTGSRTSDFKFVSSYNENTLPAGGTLKTEHNFQFGSNMITLDVTGNEDEPENNNKKKLFFPELKDMTYEDNNSKLTSYLIIGLVCVSTFFLTFIILIMAVKFCHRRKPRLLFDGAVAVPSAYLPPNYAEVDGAGTLRSSYNYDAYLTTGSRTSDFKFVSSYNENTLPAGGTLKKEHNIQFGSSMITLDVTGNEDEIVKSTDPGLFSIGLHSGEIKTQRDISESDNMKQNLVISVKDNGQPSLSTTCAVNLLISDNLSEVPELKDMTYEDNKSKLTSYLIIALVCVSTFFLTFIILIVAVKFCHRRKPRLLFDGAVAVPSAYLPPNYAEVDGAGTLRSSYNYDAYLTTGSRTSDFKFVSSYNENTLPAGGTLKKEHNIQFGSSMIKLDVTGNEDEVREP